MADIYYSPPKTPTASIKKTLTYVPFSKALDRSQWELSFGDSGKGGSPYRGVGRFVSKERAPGAMIGLFGMLYFSLI